MTLVLSKNSEELLDRLLATGRFRNANEAVDAGLRSLNTEETSVYPAGSLLHLYTDESNAEEREMAKVSSMKLES